MKEWKECDIVELDIEKTEKQSNNSWNNGNNDTHIHKGWCEMHKHPENGICTCGVTLNGQS